MIQTRLLSEDEIDSNLFDVFVDGVRLGLSAGFSAEDSRIECLAICSDSTCLIVEFKYPASSRRSEVLAATLRPGLEILRDRVLCRDTIMLLAFDLAPLAMALYSDLGIVILNGIDIQSGYLELVDRRPVDVIKDAVGDNSEVRESNVERAFASAARFSASNRQRYIDLTEIAWISQFVGNVGNGFETLDKVKRIDTKNLPTGVIDLLASMVRNTRRLDQSKPNTVRHAFTPQSASGNEVQVKSTVYNTRLRHKPAGNLSVVVNDPRTGTFRIPVQLTEVAGRTAVLESNFNLSNRQIVSDGLVSSGPDKVTRAEFKAAETIRLVLQGDLSMLSSSPFVQNIWFPSTAGMVWPENWAASTEELPTADESLGRFSKLNVSQQDAVLHMLSQSSQNHIVLVQGPPGTGKTSVIITYVEQAIQAGQSGIWLIAASNVAVRVSISY
ncbi:hypothetical protein FISHEDRAFT_78066 [Fistulina hepatica ATCC 64428]|nr:hypothetical protein FISHEDRAFT_78066 [Fistulina hepatica ATCC 64428]